VPPPPLGVISEDRILCGGQRPKSQLKLAAPENETFGPLAFPELLQNPGDVVEANEPLVSVKGSACAITAADRQKLIARRSREIILPVIVNLG